MAKMIFIGGVHGVGKTSLCKEISNKLGIPHYSASQLIADIKKEHFSNNKLIENIDKNQDFLTQALDNLKLGDTWFLLDGHFCLLNGEGAITKIPEETFHNLSPLGIVVLTDSAQQIAERLNQRDNTHFSPSLLESFQADEVAYAESLASTLNIPCLSSKVNEIVSIHKFIEELCIPR